MESIIDTFHIDWKIIIAQAVNFGIVFTVLYVFALKPLNKLMSERSEKIAKGINDAKENAQVLANTRAEYEAALSKARTEADKIFEAGKKEADAKRQQMLAEAKEEVAVMVQSGRETLEADKTKTVAEAKKEIVSLAMKAAEKLLGEKGQNWNEKAIKELENL